MSKESSAAEGQDSNPIVFPQESNFNGPVTTSVFIVSRRLVDVPNKQTDANGKQPDIIFN